MARKGTNRQLGVRRITVDSVLDADLIRLEVCTLRGEFTDFDDAVGEWRGHRDSYITSDDYHRKLRLTSGQQAKYSFSSFKEGQVFLSGEFEVSGGGKGRKRFKVSPGKRKFMPIHTIIRKDLERLYFEALDRGD